MDSRESPILEEELVERSKKGDHQAFEQLVETYYDQIYSLVMGYTKNHDDAFDLTQETFLEAYRCIQSFEGRSRFYTWLYRIGTNLTINFLKKKKAQTSNEDFIFDQSPQIHLPSDEEEEKEFYKIFFKYLDRLGEEKKSVFILREFHGLSYEEISEILGIKMGTVMSRLSRAREEMKGYLEKYL